jgi:hypothetical protein
MLLPTQIQGFIPLSKSTSRSRLRKPRYVHPDRTAIVARWMFRVPFIIKTGISILDSPGIFFPTFTTGFRMIQRM